MSEQLQACGKCREMRVLVTRGLCSDCAIFEAGAGTIDQWPKAEPTREGKMAKDPKWPRVCSKCGKAKKLAAKGLCPACYYRQRKELVAGARPAPTKKAGRAKTRPQSPAAPANLGDGKDPGVSTPPPREVVDVDKWHVPPLPVSPAFKLFPAIERYNKAAQELINGLNAMGKQIQEAGLIMREALSALKSHTPPPPKGPVETR